MNEMQRRIKTVQEDRFKTLDSYKILKQGPVAQPGNPLLSFRKERRPFTVQKRTKTKTAFLLTKRELGK